MNPIDYQKRAPIKKKETLYNETKKTVKSLIITLSLMIFALTIVFFVTTNASAQKGYTLEQEKLKNEHLKSLNESLTAKITNSTSVSQFAEKTIAEEKQKIEELETKQYITPEDNKVN